MVVFWDVLDFQIAQTAVFQAAGHLAEDHLGAGKVAELFLGHLEAIEIQAETQEAAATSIPVPQTLDPEGQDIDLPRPRRPCSAVGNSGAC